MDEMMSVVHCRRSHVTVVRYDAYASYDVEIWWKSYLLLRLSYPETEHQATCARAKGLDNAGTTRYLSQEHWDELSIDPVPMATPSSIPFDWSPEFSMEDCNSVYNDGRIPSIADGQMSQCLDAPTPALYIDSQEQPRWLRSTSRTPLEPPQQCLDFVRYEDWDADATYGNVPSTCIHYRVEWSVKVDRKVVSRNTEEDIVLEPTSYGPLVLQPRLEELLKRKIIPPRSVQAQDTDVVLKVADRSEDDFVTQYQETSVDWVQVQRRLLTWSELFRKGKKARGRPR
ncbi:hypothetical protein LTR51_008635 [Lithohypha guttulata]|nr:hypothetical protein LTR51_008635 [Lithohypha guttulata]